MSEIIKKQEHTLAVVVRAYDCIIELEYHLDETKEAIRKMQKSIEGLERELAQERYERLGPDLCPHGIDRNKPHKSIAFAGGMSQCTCCQRWFGTMIPIEDFVCNVCRATPPPESLHTCPHCGRDYFVHETILSDGELGCSCQLESYTMLAAWESVLAFAANTLQKIAFFHKLPEDIRHEIAGYTELDAIAKSAWLTKSAAERHIDEINGL